MSTGKSMTYTELADVLASLPLLLREARRARGLSTRATAVEVGCAFSTIARMEHGDECVTSNAVAVMRWLDQTADHPKPEASDTEQETSDA